MPDEPTTEGAHPSLRAAAYRSGRILVARHVAGVVVRLAGMLVVTRLIGPTAYGLFAGSAAIIAVLSTIATFGLDVHLLRTTESESDLADATSEHTAFTMLTASSIALSLVGLAMAPAFGAWLGDPDVVGPMRAMALVLPVIVLAVPARTSLERDLRFGPVAAAEVAADVSVYVVAIPLALAGASVWAPVGGFIARQTIILVANHAVSGYRPRLWIERGAARRALGFGAGYSAGRWVSIAGQLVNPILVGRLLGPAGVGQVALATRIVEQLGAVKQATMRLALAALARLDGDPVRLRAAHSEGVLVQMLGSGPAYAAAAFTAPWLVPGLFGAEWEPAVEVVALLAIAATIGTLFNLHASTLRVLDRNGPVARLRVLQVTSFAAATAVLVPIFDVAGYGVARLVRAIPFVVIDRDLRSVFAPRYLPGLRWAVGLVPMMLSPWVTPGLRPLLLLPVLAVIAAPSSRAELRVLATRVTADPSPA